MPQLLDLPNEILYHLAGYLARELDISSMARTNGQCHDLFNTFLYHSNAMHEQIVGGILLSQEGVNPNLQCRSEKDVLCMSLLSRAARAGHADIVIMLLSTKGIDPNLGDTMGRSPVVHAAFGGQDAVVKQILDTPGVDPSFKDLHGRTPLSWTVVDTDGMLKKGWTALMFSLLLEMPHIDIDHQIENGKTDLHFAARHGSEDIERLLLARGANPDPKDRHNRSPLYLSAHFGHLGVVKLLHEAGADLDSVTSGGGTPLITASSCGFSDMVLFLLETGRVALGRQEEDMERNSFSFAAQGGYLEIVQKLIQYGEVTNTKDYKGRTPLSYAVEYGNIEIARVLLLNSSPVDCEGMDADGETLLSRASRHCDLDISDLLASVTASDLQL
ncbi:ankyrin repeat domain-containing protein [Aspergillus alliaceus]|uniref:ankyrin repeat domain-containing protein n=1 Tax=Petromyces alliaceus TaxID=209559 RepID=UPI0012A7028C|nr:ankyrin repeat-containing domain protein [Aspergillus alliaceus]KAB8238277.1 ankyrin repeat-containing domain protein [Aspergillus alliaceus]